MPMTQIPLSGPETETDSVTSKTSTLQDILNPSHMSNAQKDILQIIRKEEDQAMSLLAASPLLSSLFLTYANRAAALDGPPTPSPIDREWSEMKALNSSLQEEVTSLRAQLEKEADRAKAAEDCVEALRAQVSSFRDTTHALEVEVYNEHAKLEAITSEYAEHKKEAADAIAELRDAVAKEAGARAALSQVIADQQISLAQLKEKNERHPSPPAATKVLSGGPPLNEPATVKSEDAEKQIGAHKQQNHPVPPKDEDGLKFGEGIPPEPKDYIKPASNSVSGRDTELSSKKKPKARPHTQVPSATKGEFHNWF